MLILCKLENTTISYIKSLNVTRPDCTATSRFTLNCYILFDKSRHLYSLQIYGYKTNIL
jgi:hypothetical protein